MIITLLLYRAAQTNTGDFPYASSWAFASHGIGHLLHPLGRSANKALETAFLDLNVVVILGFLVFLVHSKHLHIVAAPINVAFSRQPRALGPLDSTPDMDVENMDEDTVFGAGHIEHFSWKQMLDFVTCTECGRCQSQCPAWNTGKPLSPKLVIMDLRDELFRNSERVFAAAGRAPAAGGLVAAPVPRLPETERPMPARAGKSAAAGDRAPAARWGSRGPWYPA